MRFSKIINYPRTWNSTRYPFVAHIEIPAERFRQFEKLFEDQTQARVVGHDLADDDQVVIHVGCKTDETKRSLESRWA